MKFHTISPAYFGAQTPVKRASFPVSNPGANVYGTKAPKDSVHFGNIPTHHYKVDVSAPHKITIISPSGEKRYTIDTENPRFLNAEYSELMYNLFHNGAYVGSIFKEDESGWTAYSLNDDTEHFRYNLERVRETESPFSKVMNWRDR